MHSPGAQLQYLPSNSNGVLVEQGKLPEVTEQPRFPNVNVPE